MDSSLIKCFILIMPLFIVRCLKLQSHLSKARNRKLHLKMWMAVKWLAIWKRIHQVRQITLIFRISIHFLTEVSSDIAGLAKWSWFYRSTRDQSMSNSSVRPQNSPYFCVGQKNAGGHRKGLEGGETGERREKYGFFIFSAFAFSFASQTIAELCEARIARISRECTLGTRSFSCVQREFSVLAPRVTRVKTDSEKGLPRLFLRLLLD